MLGSALTFVIDAPGLDMVPFCRANLADRGLPPHLTVLYPWYPAPLDQRQIDLAAGVVAGTGEIQCRFGELAVFPAGVVYAAVDDPTPVTDLMLRVFTAFPDIPPYGGEHDSPVPHITLAKCEPHELDKTLAAVQEEVDGVWPFEVTLTHLAVLQQADNRRWHMHQRLDLL